MKFRANIPTRFKSGQVWEARHSSYHSLWRFNSKNDGNYWSISVISLSHNKAFRSVCSDRVLTNPQYKLKFKSHNPLDFDIQYKRTSKL